MDLYAVSIDITPYGYSTFKELKIVAQVRAESLQDATDKVRNSMAHYWGSRINSTHVIKLP